MAKLTPWHRVAADEFLAAVAQRGPVTLTGHPTAPPRVRIWWRLTWMALDGQMTTVDGLTLRTLYERAAAEEQDALGEGAESDDDAGE